MANVENRAAEHGSEIIDDTTPRSWFAGRRPCALRILEDTTFTAITSPNCENIEYYLTAGALEDKSIIATISSLTLATGAVQAVFS